MAYGKSEAADLILKACRELKEKKLIIRTWGNISARLSSELILITPSGRDYDSLTAEDLVTVNITTGKPEGDALPSSETGVHMECYRAREDVSFVIHTHQPYASAISVLGNNIKLGNRVAKSVKDLVGQGIVCADYGQNGSKKICKAVTTALNDHPDTNHVLLQNHGAVCMGETYEQAFDVTYTLEALCKKLFEYYCEDAIPLTEQIRRFKRAREEAASGDKTAQASPFDAAMTLAGDVKPITVVQSVTEDIDRASEAVGQWILHVRTPYIMEISSRDMTLKAYLDDMAQIAGQSVKCVSAGEGHRTVMKVMGSANAVFVENDGAYCTGSSYDEALCVAEVLEKGCMAAYLGLIRGADPIGFVDAYIDRYKYTKKYSKLINEE